jgi:pimeloyl-ACP methyl ester carboxylesterase
VEFSVSYFTTPDGVRLAYGTLGEGSPVIAPPGWISNIESLDENPYAVDLYEGLARRHQVIVYDKQGCGLSEREATAFTIERLVGELTALIDHLEVDRVTLLGNSQGGLTTMAYAAEHPERVSRLALNSAYASGPKTFTNAKVQESMLTVVGAHWGIGAKVLTDMFIPGASPEEAEAFTKRQRRGASAEVAAGYLKLNYETDVSELLSKISTPTLVLHNRGDRAVPFRGGQQIAMGIPHARFVAGEGSIHGRLTEEHRSLLLDFLSEDEAAETSPEAPPTSSRSCSPTSRGRPRSRSASATRVRRCCCTSTTTSCAPPSPGAGGAR